MGSTYTLIKKETLLGSKSHHFILKYIQYLEGSIVEIGSSNGEGSTDFFAGLVHGHKHLDFYTVDFNNNQYDHTKNLASNISNMQAYCMLGEDFLKEIFPTFNKSISWAYLDNYDWNWFENRDVTPTWILEQKKIYDQHGFEYSNQASQNSHLLQTKIVHTYAAKKCFIHFDDTWETNQKYQGKGGKAVSWLLDNNWKIIDQCNDKNFVIMTNFLSL